MMTFKTAAVSAQGIRVVSLRELKHQLELHELLDDWNTYLRGHTLVALENGYRGVPAYRLTRFLDNHTVQYQIL